MEDLLTFENALLGCHILSKDSLSTSVNYLNCLLYLRIVQFACFCEHWQYTYSDYTSGDAFLNWSIIGHNGCFGAFSDITHL